MGEIVIKRAVDEREFDQAMELAFRVFLKFEAEEYGKEGTDNFAEFVTSPDVKKLFLTNHYLIYVALDGDEIVGVITLRSGNHISLLFVHEDYHNLGIGKSLVLRGAEYLVNNTDFETMTVHSSPYALGFYHRLGFEDTGAQAIDAGIIYTPMELPLA